MGWITMGYHFVSSVINCGIEHSAQISKTAIDFVTCMTAKFFQ